jgi:hypothetical protein
VQGLDALAVRQRLGFDGAHLFEHRLELVDHLHIVQVFDATSKRKTLVPQGFLG